MARNWYRDDPVRDAEDAAIDKRPFLGCCVVCGKEIHGSDEWYEADDAYFIDNELVCYDCLHEYFKDSKI